MFKILIVFFAIFFLMWLIPVILFHPSNDRDWSLDQKTLAYAEIEGNLVHLKNIRNFSYMSADEYSPNYYDKTFDVKKLQKVYYIVEPFSKFAGAAHTFLGFEFEGGEFVDISVEIRKEKGETFSPLKGLFRQYEIMYVIADERDAVKLRTNYRNDPVYIYPGKTTGNEKIKKLFLSMIARANELRQNPEFYNTLTNTCMTSIVRHINEVAEKKINYGYKILLPGYSDKLAYELGLIDTNLPFEKIREHFYINNRAKKYAGSPDFSKMIRKWDEM